MARSSPVVAGLIFRQLISARRKTLKLSGAAVARKLRFSRNHWSMIENGHAHIGQQKVTELLDLFDFSFAEREELMKLDEQSRQEGWWAQDLGNENRVLAELCGLEAGAKSIRAFESLTVPGLLQTTDYARAVISTDPLVGQLDLNRLVDVRGKRQNCLTEDDPLDFVAILPEAALRHHVRDRRLQIEQLVQISELCQANHNVEVRVIPFDRHPATLAMASTLLLLDFDSEHLSTQAFQESFSFVGLVDSIRQVERAELAWSAAYRDTLSKQESLNLIAMIVEELERG